jgi:sulfate adenylyltransferase subunit 1 (EFTu-like GTPase family)
MSKSRYIFEDRPTVQSYNKNALTCCSTVEQALLVASQTSQVFREEGMLSS